MSRWDGIRDAGSRLTTGPADDAGSDAKRSRARLTAAELMKEVAARELEGLRAWALDVAALAGETLGTRRCGRRSAGSREYSQEYWPTAELLESAEGMRL